MTGPAFYNLARRLPSIRCFCLFWWFRLFQPCRFGRFVGIDDFDWVVSVASLVSVVAFCCFGCHLMIFDVICPYLNPLPLSHFGADFRGSQWGKNRVCLRGSNFRIFIRFPFSVSYGLLFLPICLPLFLSAVFFLSVACIDKFPFFNTLGTLVRVNLSRIASGRSESFTKEFCKAQ